MKFSPFSLLLGSVLWPALLVAQSFVAVSLEEFNLQQSATGVGLQEAAFYAEVTGLSGVNFATGSINGGSAVPLPPDGGDYVLKDAFATTGELLSHYPADGTYTLALDTTAGPRGAVLVGPGTYAAHRPAAPLFTLNGVTGTWHTPTSGPTQFRFVPSEGLSFTVTLNSYQVTTSGGHYAWFMRTRDLLDTGVELGGVGSDIELDTTPYQAPSFSFTYGLSGNTDTAYGFTAGSAFSLEAAFYNIVDWQSAGMAAPYDAAMQGFIFGHETQLVLVAVPETATWSRWLGLAALLLAAARQVRRRNASQLDR